MRFFLPVLTGGPMLTAYRVCATTLTLAAIAFSNTQAQSAADIINQMVSDYEQQTQGVDNYTVVQEIMGMETVSYFQKEVVSGHPVFRMRETKTAGMTLSGDETGSGGWDGWYTLAPELIARATYEGTDNLAGQKVHVISVKDLHEIGFGPGMSQGDADFEPRSAMLFVDTDESLMRRMVFKGLLVSDGESHEVTSTVDLQDYREVEGMLHPFHITMSMEGLGAAMDAETRKQYEEMKQQLEEMPAEQRKMMESMMKGQMENFEQMMSGDGPMSVEVRVKEVRINSGPPGGE
jgi:hypothetical protein